MTFYDFVIEKYYGKDSPRGDLAYDMERDKKTFPVVYDASERSKRIIKNYLIRRNACEECLDTFNACWTSYRNYLRKYGGII